MLKCPPTNKSNSPAIKSPKTRKFRMATYTQNTVDAKLFSDTKLWHTCKLSVIRTESPSFSSRQNLRPRRRKSPSFEHRLFFRFRAIISYFPVIILMNGLCKKTAMASRRNGSPCAGNARKKKAYKAHFNPDWVRRRGTPPSTA